MLVSKYNIPYPVFKCRIKSMTLKQEQKKRNGYNQLFYRHQWHRYRERLRKKINRNSFAITKISVDLSRNRSTLVDSVIA